MVTDLLVSFLFSHWSAFSGFSLVSFFTLFAISAAVYSWSFIFPTFLHPLQVSFCCSLSQSLSLFSHSLGRRSKLIRTASAHKSSLSSQVQPLLEEQQLQVTTRTAFEGSLKYQGQQFFTGDAASLRKLHSLTSGGARKDTSELV